MNIVGIDPGKTGGIVVLDPSGKCLEAIPMPMAGDDIDTNTVLMLLHSQPEGTRAVIERVGSFPGHGVSSVWSFGFGTGKLHGIIEAAGIPLDVVSPVTWQKAGPGKTGGDKGITAAWAARSFPGAPIVQPRCRKPHEGICDALGIAWWGWIQYRAGK